MNQRQKEAAKRTNDIYENIVNNSPNPDNTEKNKIEAINLGNGSFVGGESMYAKGYNQAIDDIKKRLLEL